MDRNEGVPVFPVDDDDLNNISKDDSEDFFVEDTAFFRSAASEPNSEELLSPVPSPTPFGTPRVRSAHSLYGEALLHSTRPLSTGNNTCSTIEDEEKMMYALQQPLIPEEENQSSTFEDLLVSPTSPISETPTTPPSVAPKPSLSPPPLILSRVEEDTPAPVPAPAHHVNNNNNNLQPSSSSFATESFSYSSRTPLRPPRVPGSQSRQPATTNTATTSAVNNSNNSGHKRQHRRNGSDNSLLSALTDATFGSVQTAPPPPRSLPLPLLSSSSSWTRYTNLGSNAGHHLPVLDNAVSGMNISVPANLQQPVLPDDEAPENAAPTNPGGGGTHVLRHSTPPRHRPPKDRSSPSKGRSSTTSKTSGLQQQPLLPSQKKTTMASGTATALPSSLPSPRSSKTQPPAKASSVFRPSSSPSTATTSPTAFMPIPHRPRSFSSEPASPVVTKPRSYSSDVVLSDRRPTTVDEQSLLDSSSSALLSPTRQTDEDQRCHKQSMQLQSWFLQAFSSTEGILRPLDDAFGLALLRLDSLAVGTKPMEEEEDPPLRKIASAASSLTEVSRQSHLPANDTKKTDNNRDASIQQDFSWSVLFGLLSVLMGFALTHDATSTGTVGGFVFFVQQLILLLVSRFVSCNLLQSESCLRVLNTCFNKQSCLFVFISRGWPIMLLIWALLEGSMWSCCGNALLYRPEGFDFSGRLVAAAWLMGFAETARRYLIGYATNFLVLRRFGLKLQHEIQRVAVIRRLARFARIRAKDFSVTFLEEKGSEGGPMNLDDMLSFHKACGAFRGDRALSKEFGPAANRKERKTSADTLFDALAVQGCLDIAILLKAVDASDVLLSTLYDMFPSSTGGVVDQSDFVDAIEFTHENIQVLIEAIENEFELLSAIRSASLVLLHCLCISYVSWLTLLVPGVVAAFGSAAFTALVHGCISSSWFEGVVFAIFGRPYNKGDIITIGSSAWRDFKCTVERVGLWNTVVRHEGMKNGTTLFANADIARCAISTTNGFLATPVDFRLRLPMDVSHQKLATFRKVVQGYVNSHKNEWIEIVSMDAVSLSDGCIEYELILRHRLSATRRRSVLESQIKFKSFCFQSLSQVGIDAKTAHKVVTKQPATLEETAIDDASEDSLAGTEHENLFSDKIF